MAGREDSPELLRGLLDELPTLTLLMAGDGEVRWASAGVERMFGRPIEEVVGTSILEYLDPTWDPVAFDSIGAALEAEGVRLPMLFRVLLPDGGTTICEVWASSQLHDPVLEGLVVTVRRWDERVLLDKALESLGTDEPLRATLEMLVDVIGAETLEAAGVIHVFDNGGSSEVVAHTQLDGVLAAADGVTAPWDTARASGTSAVLQVDDLPEPLRSAAHAAGFEIVWAWPVVDPRDGTVAAVVTAWRRHDQLVADHTRAQLLDHLCRIVGIALDRNRMLSRLQHAAHHDGLTGLVNRTQFYAALDDRLSVDTAADVAVLYIDLDGFKPVNDRLGHGAGDNLLTLVGERLEAIVRTGDVVARLGGDEFAVLCAPAPPLEQLESLAARLLASLAEPVVLGGERVTIGASVGIACSAAGETTGDALVEAADTALREAKVAGKGVWRIAT